MSDPIANPEFQIVEFERSGFWRRAGALLIDAIIVTLLLQCVAMALFPLTGGRVQFANGLNLLYCDKLDAAPEGVPVPADFNATSITDCRQGPIPGLPSSRILRVNRVTQNGAYTTTATIGRFLDANGKVIEPLTLDSAVLPLLLVLRWLFDRRRGSPGRRICRIRLATADGIYPPPAAVANRRYAALVLPLAPLLLWGILYDRLSSLYATNGAHWPLLVTMVLGAPAAIALLEALHAAIFREDAWCDRFAGTRLLRVAKGGAVIPVPVAVAAPPPLAPEPDWSQPLVTEQAVADALGVDRAPLGVAFTPLTLPPPLPPPPRNYFVRHWLGELSLPKSYWVNGLLGGFFVGVAVVALNSAVHSRSEAQPVLWLAALIATWVVVSLFTMWQAVGVWRSATNYKASGKYFWGGLAKTVTVLGVVNLAYNCLFVGTAQMAGIYEIIDGDARVGPHQFKVLANGQVLEFSGGITFGVANELNGFLNAMGNVRTVRLNSMGGRILEAQRMSDLIRARGLITFVAQDCMSACTIVFLGGKERMIFPAARIGFHQPAFRGMTAASRAAAIATEQARLQRFGLSREFAARANTATPSGMWFPDHDELVREKVVTRVVPPPPAPVAAKPATAPAAAAATPGAGAEAGRATIPPDVIKRLSGDMARLGMKKTPPVAPAPAPSAAATPAGDAERK